jgi:hypothetical protein
VPIFYFCILAERGDSLLWGLTGFLAKLPEGLWTRRWPAILRHHRFKLIKSVAYGVLLGFSRFYEGKCVVLAWWIVVIFVVLGAGILGANSTPGF